MNIEVVGEDVPRGHQVVLDAVHGQPVHAEVLGQQRLAVPLHYVLRTTH